MKYECLRGNGRFFAVVMGLFTSVVVNASCAVGSAGSPQQTFLLGRALSTLGGVWARRSDNPHYPYYKPQVRSSSSLTSQEDAYRQALARQEEARRANIERWTNTSSIPSTAQKACAEEPATVTTPQIVSRLSSHYFEQQAQNLGRLYDAGVELDEHLIARQIATDGYLARRLQVEYDREAAQLRALHSRYDRPAPRRSFVPRFGMSYKFSFSRQVRSFGSWLFSRFFPGIV